MDRQRLLSYVRRAVDDYGMIRSGDRIAVGVSGGKDSLCLLVALAGLRRFYPQRFDLCAVTVSLGLPGTDFSAVADLCRELDVPYQVVETDIGTIIFDDRKEKNPCSLCSKMRKGALNEKALALGCNKIALGHNQNDVTETFFMSLLYEGRLNCFAPVTFLDRTGLTSIRPLMYVPEEEARGFARRTALPVVKNPCPANGNTKRQEVKELLAQLKQKYPHIQEKTFTAVRRSPLPGWKEAKNNGQSDLP